MYIYLFYSICIRSYWQGWLLLAADASKHRRSRSSRQAAKPRPTLHITARHGHPPRRPRDSRRPLAARRAAGVARPRPVLGIAQLCAGRRDCRVRQAAGGAAGEPRRAAHVQCVPRRAAPACPAVHGLPVGGVLQRGVPAGALGADAQDRVQDAGGRARRRRTRGRTRPLWRERRGSGRPPAAHGRPRARAAAAAVAHARGGRRARGGRAAREQHGRVCAQRGAVGRLQDAGGGGVLVRGLVPRGPDPDGGPGHVPHPHQLVRPQRPRHGHVGHVPRCRAGHGQPLVRANGRCCLFRTQGVPARRAGHRARRRDYDLVHRWVSVSPCHSNLTLPPPPRLGLL